MGTDGLALPIGKSLVGAGRPCFIVAELSGNHHQRYDEALELVRAASAAGADAVKLQTYTPDTMTIDCDKDWFRVEGKDTPGSWNGKTLYRLYQEAHTPWEWHAGLKAAADELGMLLFSTPFDETAVDFLEGLDVPCYKIASYEATDIPLLRRVAKTRKPVMLSVGFADAEEVSRAVAALREGGAPGVALLHCVTGYEGAPDPRAMNLRTIADLRERFGVAAGFSDNNAGIDVPVMAVSAGASIVEKHLILRRSAGGPDCRFSIEPEELKEMVRRIREAETILGAARYGPANDAEAYNKRFRRSLFVVKDTRRGERFTRENVRVIRPEFGLAPRFLDEVLGKTAARDIERGTPLTRDLVE